MYASNGYCYGAGELATAALSSAHQVQSLSACPLIWNTAGYAQQQTFQPATNTCTPNSDVVIFPTCSQEGQILPASIFDPIGDSTSFYLLALLLLSSIWALKRIQRIFERDNDA